MNLAMIVQKLASDVAELTRLVLAIRAGGVGETNTASNQGVGGIGLYHSKVGVDLQFKNINAGSTKITVANDAPNKEVDIDVVPANIDHGGLGGLGDVIDHLGYITIDGTRELTGSWDAGCVAGRVVRSGYLMAGGAVAAMVERLQSEARLALKETTDPAATANYGKIWASSADGLLYYMDDAGNIYDLTAAGGGSGGATIDAHSPIHLTGGGDLTYGLPYKEPTDAPDDDFTDAALDVKWTVVDGAAGTVNLLGAAGNIYDLGTRVSFLLVQAINGDEFQIRQDYTLPDGYSLILAINPSVSMDGAPTITNNEIWAGFSLNNNDGAFNAGTYQAVMFDTDTNNVRIIHWDGTVLGSTPQSLTIGHKCFLRIARSSLTYYAFLSRDGETWIPLASKTVAAEHNNLWLFVDCQAAVSTPVPIQAFDYILLGSNGLVPW
jgi:hypothetical protein